MPIITHKGVLRPAGEALHRSTHYPSHRLNHDFSLLGNTAERIQF